MKHKQIKKIADKQLKEIVQHWGTIALTFDAEAIHHFRVAYKRIRALFRLILLRHPESKLLVDLNKMKDVYHTAGVLRNLQLCKQAIMQNDFAASCIAINRRIEQAKGELGYAISMINISKLKFTVPHKVHTKDINRFVHLRANLIMQLRRKAHSQKNLHSIRKCLKDILYNVEAIHKHNTLEQKNTKWERQLDVLVNMIGDYNDLISNLKLIRITSLDEDMRKRLSTEWKRQKSILKRKITDTINSIGSIIIELTKFKISN